MTNDISARNDADPRRPRGQDRAGIVFECPRF